ncbi:MAG: adenine phosphoribosyltransferase [Thermoplasmata archaeon]|nr:MAG: adenine phosphoribosyltransferase [Thermoplasmata archaeon]
MSSLHDMLGSAIKSAPRVEHGGKIDIYPNFGSLSIEPELVNVIVAELGRLSEFNCDKIALIESMAIPVGTALALDKKLPYTVIRKRKYNLPGEVSVKKHTGYSRADFYINGISEGQKIMVFDDTINTGETLRAVIKTLRHIGSEITDVLTIMDKGTHRARLEAELNLKIKTLVKVDIQADTVELSFEVD